MTAILLFGAGSPVIVDVEESCARRGWRIAAAIRNVAAPDQTGAETAIQALTPDLVLAHPVLVPLFTPANRLHAWRQASALGAEASAPLVDPTAILPRRIEIGEGSYINAGCTIGAVARIGRFAFINRGAMLGHHLELGAFASIGPGVVIAGQVTIGRAALIGAGAVILPGLRIGDGAIVPAGAVIRHDVAAGATARR